MAWQKVLLKLYVGPRLSAHCYKESATINQSQSKSRLQQQLFVFRRCHYVYQYLLSDDDEEIYFIILRQRAPCQAEECQRVLEEPFLEG